MPTYLRGAALGHSLFKGKITIICSRSSSSSSSYKPAARAAAHMACLVLYFIPDIHQPWLNTFELFDEQMWLGTIISLPRLIHQGDIFRQAQTGKAWFRAWCHRSPPHHPIHTPFLHSHPTCAALLTGVRPGSCPCAPVSVSRFVCKQIF